MGESQVEPGSRNDQVSASEDEDQGVTDSNSEYCCSCGSADGYSIGRDDEYEDEEGEEQDEEVKGKTNYESMCSVKETVLHIEAIHSKLENCSGQEAVCSPISKGNQDPSSFF